MNATPVTPSNALNTIMPMESHSRQGIVGDRRRILVGQSEILDERFTMLTSPAEISSYQSEDEDPMDYLLGRRIPYRLNPEETQPYYPFEDIECPYLSPDSSTDTPLGQGYSSYFRGTTISPLDESMGQVFPGLNLRISRPLAETSLEVEKRDLRGYSYRYFAYYIESGATAATVLVDKPIVDVPRITEFGLEYRQVINDLRNGGREILAEDLGEMLRNIQEDPEEVDIEIFSLQAMARFLIKHGRFDDPIAGPDPTGIMQVEWHICGNGLLVMAFLEDDKIHFIAQADETPKELNKSALLTEKEMLEEFGYLVPLRYSENR